MLEQLVVDETPITDACIPYMIIMPRLRMLHAVRTNISNEGVLALKMGMPQTHVVTMNGYYEDPEESMS